MSAVLETIEAQSRELFPKGKAILVAVSGGVDSMGLLYGLNYFAKQYKWRLVAAHFNHRLRGNSSRADQRLIEKSAHKLGLDCVVGQWKQDANPIKEHGPEMAARLARHEFLAQAAKKRRCGIIAMAHHQDDQVETFLWRLMRGAGGKGLGGMRERSPFPDHPKLTVARPFLQIPKRELRRFAESEGIQFREDASNEDTNHLRNRIRHQLLPELRRNFHTEIDRAILQSQGLIGADADFVSAAAREWIASPKRMAFSELHPALQRWVIWHQLIELKLEPQHHQIETLRQTLGRSVSINPQQALRVDPDGLVQLHETKPLKHDLRQNLFAPSARWSEHVLAKTRIRCRIAPIKPREFSGEVFDANQVGGKILLRHWQPGDRYQPIGMEHPVKLQDLFTNAKVPATEKRQRVLACTEAGEIFWVQGLRIGEIAKTRPNTSRFLGWICGQS